jgi:undecaprenyl pyrophosphate phosphatase UppP
MRGFTREDAQALSWSAGLPVLMGAAGLKAGRLAFGEPSLMPKSGLVLAAVASFGSTSAAARICAHSDAPRLWPFSLYRLALALLVLKRSVEAGGRRLSSSN